MNKWGKLLLVATSLTPIFFVCFLKNFSEKRFTNAAIWFGIFLGLCSLFLFIFFMATKKLPEERMTTTKIKSADKEVLAFLLSYLLPLSFRDHVDFPSELSTIAVVVAVIGLTIINSTAFTYNPILALLQYRFYEVESQGMTYLIISPLIHCKPNNHMLVKRLFDFTYIEVDQSKKPKDESQ